MKRLAIAVTMLAIGVAGCGSSSNPTSPDTIKIFTVPLSSANENPPITNAEQGAKGTAVITIHTDTNTIDFSVSLNSFPNGANVILAHIHPGVAGVNGPALIGVGLSATNNLPLPNGSGTFTFTGVTAQTSSATAAANVQAILANPQNFYFNVHTTANPGGVMRGQMQ